MRRWSQGQLRCRRAIQGRMTVHSLPPLDGNASPEVRRECSNEFRDALATGKRFLRRAYESTAIRVGRNIFGEQVLQRGHISLLSGIDKRRQKATLLRRANGGASAICDVFTAA